MEYIGDLKAENKTLKFPALGEDTNNDGTVDTEFSALEGLPTHCPFYKLPLRLQQTKGWRLYNR